jgi:hypothetical protein
MYFESVVMIQLFRSYPGVHFAQSRVNICILVAACSFMQSTSITRHTYLSIYAGEGVCGKEEGVGVGKGDEEVGMEIEKAVTMYLMLTLESVKFLPRQPLPGSRITPAL